MNLESARGGGGRGGRRTARAGALTVAENNLRACGCALQANLFVHTDLAYAQDVQRYFGQATHTMCTTFTNLGATVWGETAYGFPGLQVLGARINASIP